MSHVDDFGRFYAQAVHLICPLIGFAIFWIISPHTRGTKWGKPMVTVVVLTLAPIEIVFAPFLWIGSLILPTLSSPQPWFENGTDIAGSSNRVVERGRPSP